MNKIDKMDNKDKLSFHNCSQQSGFLCYNIKEERYKHMPPPVL